MMVLYSGTTCPFSQRCRFVLFEKGMDFEIRDVDLYNKPEDISIMNPYGQVPILVERDLILYESNIINEYIDERFPHPQLMPADPVMRARARLFLFNFERELFVHVQQLERRDHYKDAAKQMDRARQQIRDRLTQLTPIFMKNKYMLGEEFSMLDVAIAPLLWRLDHYGIEMPKTTAPLLRYAERIFSRPAYIEALDPVREGDAALIGARHMAETSTKPYLIRAIHEWCTDNGYRPYIAVAVDERTVVPREFVRNGEIVLNVSADATNHLRLGNDLIEFEARFNRVARQVSIPIENVTAIYAAENGHGMAFEVPKPLAQPAEPALLSEVPPPAGGTTTGEDAAAAPEPEPARAPLGLVPSAADSSGGSAAPGPASGGTGVPGGTDEPQPPTGGPSPRPRLTRIK